MWECCNRPCALLSISAFWMVTLCSRSATRVKERDWWVLESHQPNASCASTFVTALPASRDGVKGTAMRVHHGGDGGSGCETSCAIRAAQLTPALSLRWMCCVGREIAVLFVRKPQRGLQLRGTKLPSEHTGCKAGAKCLYSSCQHHLEVSLSHRSLRGWSN